MLRSDLQHIFDLIPNNSKVLDLGCGDGSLLLALQQEKNCFCYGVEKNIKKVLLSIEKGINVLQGDLEEGLKIFDNDSFDIIVLSQTIQAMRNVEEILLEMKRVAKQSIVTFPNFGYWKNRLQICFKGHMPISENMPFQWYNTPNIHWCTLKDFDNLCKKNNLYIDMCFVITNNKPIKVMPNLLGSLALYQLTKY